MTELKSRLNQYLPNFPFAAAGSQITDLTRITSGWENEIFTFALTPGVATGEGESSHYVLRIYPGNGGIQKAASEYHNMGMLYQAGYPVPRVYHLELETSHLNKPFMVMERIRGEEMWVLLSTAPQEQRIALLEIFAALFVQLHQMDWRSFSHDPEAIEWGGEYHLVDQWLETAVQALNQFSDTGLEPVVEWLAERRYLVPCSRPSITHNDFHPNNIIIREDGTACVFDWGGLSVSDLRFDLGWTLLLSLVYAGKPFMEHVLSAYEDRCEKKIPQLDFFLVSSCARRLFDVSVSLTAGPEQLGMRPGAAEIMHSDLESLSKVYKLLKEKTGIKVTQIEKILQNTWLD